MFFLLGIWNGLGEIRAHKLRSSLTIVCVMLGVASLVLITGFITGLFEQWGVWQREYGWNQRVTVESNQVPEEQKNLLAISPGQTLADTRAIRRMSRYAARVSPVDSMYVSAYYRANSSYSELRGVTSAALAVDHYKVDRGRFICDADLNGVQPVAVLGSDAVKNLFKGHEDPLGKIITINRIPFQVVGLLHDYVAMDGKYNMLDQKNRVSFVPITTMQRRLLGSDQVDSLNVSIGDTDNLGRLVEEVQSILSGTHRGVKDFKAYNQQENIQEEKAMKQGFFLVGSGIGAITLLVGGIGIMNLMLASINERVREIGIRKAIGALNRDIFAQFMAEAIALSAIGGLAGVIVGVTVVRVMRHLVMGGQFPPPVLSANAVFVGLGFSVFVGVVAGLYPAFRASRLDPIEALRYE